MVHWVQEAFRRSFEYSGRSRRMEFWIYVVFAYIVLQIVRIFEIEAGLVATSGSRDSGPLMSIATLCLFIPGIAVTVRRLHDRDFSGWWAALPFAGLVAFGVVIIGSGGDERLFPWAAVGYLIAILGLVVMLFLPGTRGPNRFGDDPKNPSLADTFN